MRSAGLCVAAALLLGLAGASGGRAAQPAGGPGCDLPNADFRLHGIELGDDESTVRVLGRDFVTVVDDPSSDFAWAIFASADRRQWMLLRHHAGDIEHSYMEFEVKAAGPDTRPLKLPAKEFVSGRGVRLGMAKADVVRLFGPCFKVTKTGNSELLRYEITDENPAAPILARSNMPQYYAEYEFVNGRLVRFRFGHDPV